MSQRLRGIWSETKSMFEAERYRVGALPVDLSADLAAMREGTRHHLPEDIAALPASVPRHDTRFEVTGESTLAALLRLAGEGEVAALNFASARNPGGGVANGARAQEESLARSSALYASLTRCPEFYAHHREERSLLYSDRVIWSPRVPVLCDDRGERLSEPPAVGFLTCAAPNRRMIERNGAEDARAIPGVLTARARGVLAVAAHHGVDVLVLGAWGCGVFGNRPEEVAAAFVEHLRGGFAGVFERVVFAVLDRDERVRAAFTDRF
ncbi:TIGR02452 family protein [Nocardiopsis lambiniae]|uniref:TIGR02452 family protein n=1 Tax=Nocardiopsis lambiniae TaxID=3075539 RepID=A0ABU2MGR5_9ACTN|nr:TIGR02452 family protein [Nocardiopsis sp. DSM 44743]MDT0331894.1 TIGR02452 family protein [Nocardiopsis sp. DSM 44743]